MEDSGWCGDAVCLLGRILKSTAFVHCKILNCTTTEMLQKILKQNYTNSSAFLLILQPFRHFTYVTAHSPTLPSLYLRHTTFSNPSVASPMSQLILQSFFCFSYVTSSSLNSPGEPPMHQTL